MQSVDLDVTGNKIRMELLAEISKKISSTSELSDLINQIMQMTEQTLKATASSVLLFDETTQDLYFEAATGEAGKKLKKMRLGAQSSQSGISAWVAHNGQPAIINDVNQDPRFNPQVDETTGFVTQSIICVPLIVNRKIIGVLEVINKKDGSGFSNEDLETLRSVASTAAIALDNTKLHQSLLDNYKSTVKALAAAIDAKDPYTRGHSHRVMEYALLGANELGLSKQELATIEYAAILHDIGKIGVPDNILLKPGLLNNEEWESMRQHTFIGANIIRGIPFLTQAQKLVLYHHERWDGHGYPHGLSRDEIPIGARLISVADTFDTITTDRAYRSSRDVNYAQQELRSCATTHFCPDSVNAFISAFHANGGQCVQSGSYNRVGSIGLPRL
jgi:HD-GYP domain-containing protein (c-di-GMP phosphodiesterase class II)